MIIFCIGGPFNNKLLNFETNIIESSSFNYKGFTYYRSINLPTGVPVYSIYDQISLPKFALPSMMNIHKCGFLIYLNEKFKFEQEKKCSL